MTKTASNQYLARVGKDRPKLKSISKTHCGHLPRNGGANAYTSLAREATHTRVAQGNRPSCTPESIKLFREHTFRFLKARCSARRTEEGRLTKNCATVGHRSSDVLRSPPADASVGASTAHYGMPPRPHALRRRLRCR